MLEIDGHNLALEDVQRVASGREREVRLAAAARSAIDASRRVIEEALEGGEPVYGVTTGFGRLSEVAVPPERRLEMQENLIRSHASGFGQPLGREISRAVVLLRANSLARGNSGIRRQVVELLLETLAHGIDPVIPEFGSVGASGDLAPLAHVALCLIGEGTVHGDVESEAAGRALERAGLQPVRLREKEGLALINGTQATTAQGVLATLRAEDAIETAELAGAMSLEGLMGTPTPFDERVHLSRPHAGQITSAARLRALLAESEIREAHRHGDPRVHDAYSLRCMPQVHGAAREVLTFVRQVLQVEINSSTDNPLVFAEAGDVVSAGNFHAQLPAQALDFLTIACTDLASISLQRVERLLNPDLSGLPPFLAGEPGVESGFMIAQVAAVDVLSELRVLSHPASVDSVTTSANKEDHVSMGMESARKAWRAVSCLQYVLAVELMCAAQALDLLKPLRPGVGVLAGYELVRQHVEPLAGDRVLGGDVEALKRLVDEGAFRDIVRGLAGS
ncbi:MAG: histidine ammonia-lyase [Gemmatimonadetes bacterium]|uniref:Histidine ammonia-lyase n=1 Tax=Candidatus Kutchimonas denitrificans TaxID=3056748 RepID=A0AAE5CCP9_9BACT|nr:histidine ammonia-lyase [Gemmatimonadota bacterium]NIR74489.1 histidine ammonia-lyase [Candidatus Kutchimonas denitrificans]NIS02679.1 histidine ammonia-lyase [Gemmatimonadota bacterium]NIT68840.1 histidine ammonia-lyase [Gemmatimonadota bacterium]NIU52145.1 histidine ammonia-lyase [Gemmatimonadota bacterium]